MGLAMLLSVPLLSLFLIRLLWSGSTIWFVIAGILMLGSAAVVFFFRRDAPAYGYQTLSPEPNHLPLWFVGLGVLFLGMLIVPSRSGSAAPAEQIARAGPTTEASNSRPPAQPTAVSQRLPVVQQPTARPSATPTQARTDNSSTASEQQASNASAPAGSQTYVVRDGDTLWDIAQQFNVTVDSIVAANKLASDSELQLGEQLIIPPSTDVSANSAAGGQGQAASEPEATPSE